MTRVGTIAKRELAAVFFSPIAYVVLFIYLLVMGILFSIFTFAPGNVTEVRRFFDLARFCLFFIIPPMTMSLIADEYRSGRIEMLRTSPLTEGDLVIGKYLGARGFYVVLLAVTLVYVLLLAIFGRPDYGAVLSCYLGMLLLGMLFVSIGLFFSSVSQNQIVAFLATLLVLGVLTFVDVISTNFAPASVSFWGMTLPIREPLNYLGVGTHVGDFLKGVVEISNTVYFLSGSFLFLFMTYLTLESRKWR